MADLAINAAVFVHIVTYNSAPATIRCIESVLSQNGVTLSGLLVSDNASSNSIVQLIKSKFADKISIEQNQINLGFCAAHNQGAKRFIESGAQYFLVLNPDVRLESDTVSELIAALGRHQSVGMASPLLLRADADLNAITPAVIDACGMELTDSLRHLDRGSGQLFNGQYQREELVFGGTGACLLISRECVEALTLVANENEALKAVVEPALINNQETRLQLFDEAFFAYREDADLCWRAGNLGWKCVYAPSARAYHTRAVVPERRSQLSAAINLMGVRNRFLLQLNNFKLCSSLAKLFAGIIFRNIVVLTAVVLTERSSLIAVKQLLQLMPRALERRRILTMRAKSVAALHK